MGKKLYLIYGSILIGIFAVIHLIFPPEWSLWIRKTNELFTTLPPLFTTGWYFLFGLGVFFFVAFILQYGIAFMASFGKIKYPEGSENFTPPISVIIPALNEEKVIGDTLETHLNSDYPKENLEIVVVASGSNDKTEEICKKYQDRLNIKIVTEPLPKKGKPAALNLGLKNAAYDLIAVYDADTQVEKSTLRYLVRPLHDQKVDVTIGPVNVRNWNFNRLTKGVAMEYTYMVGSALYFEIRNRLGRQLWIFSRNVCFRRAVLEETGGWNEDSLAEDMHISVQLAMLKKKIVHAPQAYSSEDTPTTWEGYKGQRRRWVGGYKQSMDAVMELDLRAVMLRNFGMLHFGHINNFAVGALVAALIFGLVVKDFYVMLLCLVIFGFTFGMGLIGLRRYGHGRYSVLLHYLAFFVSNFYMFAVQFKDLSKEKWAKTEK